MNVTHRCQPRFLFAIAFGLAAGACSSSDSMLPADHGRVRFVLGSEGDALAASGAFEVSSTGIVAGVSDPQHDGTLEHTDSTRDEIRPFIKAANVTFSSILARNLDGVLVNVDLDLPVSVDVLTLETGRKVQLPEGVLPEGTYDQAVVVMTEVQVTLWNDTKITINPPGGGWTAIAPLCPPVVVSGSTDATVALTLEVRRSFIFSGDHFFFVPRFRQPFFCRPPIEPDVQ